MTIDEALVVTRRTRFFTCRRCRCVVSRNKVDLMWNCGGFDGLSAECVDEKKCSIQKALREEIDRRILAITEEDR